MTRTLTIGFSPCPNDTYIFYALIHGKVRVPGITFHERLEDVETLNNMALNGMLDITKTSYHALGHIREQYALLRSGGALGRGCGPLVVVKPGTEIADVHNGPVAIPGQLTTAYLLLRLFDPTIESIQVMTFDRIMDSVSQGESIAGLIIHESRFTYPLHGLEKILDLGEWWEQYSGLPIPLGCILGKRELGREVLLRVETGVRESLEYARANPHEVMSYCKKYSQELDDQVIQSHIDLYVNDFSLDMGTEGLSAIHRLFGEAESRSIFPVSDKALLAQDCNR
jgi:1,4-dihydroxy-6-naphthoate synthase